MECELCEKRNISARIGDTKCCINCFVAWQRVNKMCYGPGCKVSGTAVKNIIDNKRFCTKCYMRFQRGKIDDGKVLKSLVNNDQNVQEKYESFQKISNDDTNSTVYKATDRQIGMTVAIKTIKVAKNERFINSEIIFMKKTRHPNIVMYIESFYFSDKVWIIMEYIPYSLQSLIGKLKFENGHIAKICSDIAKGLKYLHDFNIVHRDMKSDNIAITYNGVVKLIDLGCSVLLKRRAPPRRSIIGSTEFMVSESLILRVNNKEYNLLILNIRHLKLLMLLVMAKLPIYGRLELCW